MKTIFAILLAITHAVSISGFAIQVPASASAANIAVPVPVTQIANVPTLTTNFETTPTSFNTYIQESASVSASAYDSSAYDSSSSASSSAISSSTQTLSLKERVPPTAEEIAAKKRNFNFWFWGGGFVAPFLATFYYFGLKFWER